MSSFNDYQNMSAYGNGSANPLLFSKPGGVPMSSLDNSVNSLMGIGVNGNTGMFVGDSTPLQFSDAAGQLGAWDSFKQAWGGLPGFSTVKDGQRQLGKFDYGLQAANSLMGAYFGLKGLGQQKAQFNQAKREFDLNYGAGRTAYNNRIDGRAREMASANPNFKDTYQRVA
jgi:hypothetical protein